MAEGSNVKSLVKALKVLECFVNNEPELGITSIAKMVGINKSNAFDIINTFESMGYIEQNPSSKKYSLSVKMLQFSSVVNQHIGYYRVVYDLMDELAERAQNIVHFSIPHGTDVLYLYSSFPKIRRKNFPYRPVSGEICPMYCSSMGKAILAFSDPALMGRVEAMEKIQFTDCTIMENETLRKDVSDTKAQGYAIDRGEHQYGVAAIGVPVMDRNSKLIAAMSICGTVSSFTEENIKAYAEMLKETSYQITVRL